MTRTHLYDFHKKYAKIINFHEYEMPLWYDGIILEHLAVRNAIGIFDITHMGRGLVTGPDAMKFLNYVFTYDINKIALNNAWITSMCDKDGIVIDDLMIYKLGKKKYFIVFNCAFKVRDCTWLTKQSKAFDAEFKHISDETPQFAVQGPKAEQTMQKMTEANLSKLGWFEGTWTKIAGVDAYISRTGYTGEDGFEIYVWDTPLANPENAIKIWNIILLAGQEFGIKPCGLGARDTTRLEAGFWLEDSECDELKVTPLELGLRWAVSLEKSEFIGRETLLKQDAEGVKKKRIGIRMLERGIPRRGYDIWKTGKKIGQVTSGTFSPILKRGIAMGYVPTKHSAKGSIVEVKIKERFVKGEIVKFPFYDTTRHGRLRKKK